MYEYFYSHFIFYLLVVLCLHWFFSFVFLSVVFVLWHSILLSSVSSFFRGVSQFCFVCLCVCGGLPLGLWKTTFHIYSVPFSSECIWFPSLNVMSLGRGHPNIKLIRTYTTLHLSQKTEKWLTSTLIVEDYFPVELSPVFLVRSKSVRLVGINYIYKNTGNNLQRILG